MWCRSNRNFHPAEWSRYQKPGAHDAITRLKLFKTVSSVERGRADDVGACFIVILCTSYKLFAPTGRFHGQTQPQKRARVG